MQGFTQKIIRLSQYVKDRFEAVASEIALRCIFLLLYTREREGYGSWTAKVKFLLLPASLMNATLMPSDVFVTGSRPFS